MFVIYYLGILQLSPQWFRMVAGPYPLDHLHVSTCGPQHLTQFRPGTKKKRDPEKDPQCFCRLTRTASLVIQVNKKYQMSGENSCVLSSVYPLSQNLIPEV